MKKPRAIILKTDGINRDEETKFTFQFAGADAKIVHVNELRSKKEKLSNYNILAIPGGFSYGDDVVSGKILAVELFSFFKKELQTFIDRKDTAVIGICNGFQVLVRTGILPFRELGKMSATLTDNDSGHFECRWIDVKVDENTKCVFLKNLKGQTFSYPIAHGEGKFFTDEKVLNKIEKENQVAFRYVNGTGLPTQNYPYNPNGSLRAIVGITDTTGRVLGLMPHPECFIRPEQHPNWRRKKIEQPHGLLLFKEIVKFVSGDNLKRANIKPKKIALVGTSCVGKTSILKALEKKFSQKNNVAFVSEAAREFLALNKVDNPFSAIVQGKIQKLALRKERSFYKKSIDRIICDRSVLDAIAYVKAKGDRKGAEQLFMRVSSWISSYDKIILLDPKGVPYKLDKIRKENSNERALFHQSFLDLFEEKKISYELVSGSFNERVKKITAILEN